MWRVVLGAREVVCMRARGVGTRCVLASEEVLSVNLARFRASRQRAQMSTSMDRFFPAALTAPLPRRDAVLYVLPTRSIKLDRYPP